jgi:hypothetical protein
LAVGFILAGCAPAVRTPKTIMEKSWKGDVCPVALAISKQLAARPRVAVAIIGTAETTFSPETFSKAGGDISAWKKGEIDGNASQLERLLLQAFSGNKNFTLVDRATLEKVKDELAISDLGVSEETRLEMGKLTGATHLVIFRVFRGSSLSGPFEDTATGRLIDVQSGEVLAVQSQTAHYKL